MSEIEIDVFDVGKHVLIELEGLESPPLKIAGYLHAINEDGLFLRATNKDVPMTYSVTDALREDVAGQLARYGTAALKLEALRRREYVGVLASRKDLIRLLVEDICDEAVERKREEKPYTFHEYAVPVMTFLGMHKIATMQLSTDVAKDIEVILGAAGLGAEVEEFLAKVEEEKKKEENAG